MTAGEQKLLPVRNAILNALPPEELNRITPYLKTVRLTEGERLFAVEEPITKLWFPQTAVMSWLVQVATGETVEAGIIGYDGMVGLPAVLGGVGSPAACIVQLSGTADYMLAGDFEEHVRAQKTALQDALLLHASARFAALAQLTACHALHRIEQRLSRCILELHDYNLGERIRITHDTLSDFLGVHRPSVTYALQALAVTGTIALERRSVTVTNRAALVERACECYGVIRRTLRNGLRRIRNLQAV